LSQLEGISGFLSANGKARSAGQKQNKQAPLFIQAMEGSSLIKFKM